MKRAPRQPRAPGKGPGGRPSKLPASLDDLRPDPANPRAITAEAATGLAFSVERYGDIGGITFNAATDELVTGHQRIARLTEAGARTWRIERPVVRRGLTPPDGDAAEGAGVVVHPKTGRRFGVRLVRWTARTQREANLVANSEHLAGTFTVAALAPLAELAALPDLEPLRLDVLMDVVRKNAGGASPVVEVDVRESLIYSVIVDFRGEAEQARLLAELEGRGMKCRLLIS